ncbi:MAG: putative transcriptional regulator [Pirellulaceae bacterium]|jgi:putative transcriptional regulator
MGFLHGQFLVASPHLPDSNFYRSVVLMIHHDEEGAFGVILNRPSSNTIKDLWEMFSDDIPDCNEVIHHGGPVEGPMMALHCEKQQAESEIIPGIFLTTSKDQLEEIVRYSTSPFILISGYAGWSPGQLEGEMEVGGWLTLPASRQHVFCRDEDLWKQVVEEIGMDVMGPRVRSRNHLVDPSMN